MKKVTKILTAILASICCVCTLFGCVVSNSSQSTEKSYSITLSKTTLRLTVGEEQQLTAQIKDSTGTTVSADVEWDSSADTVCTVSDDGVVQGVASGTATLTASYEDAEATCTVTVGDSGVVPGIKLGFSSLEMYESEEYSFEPKLTYESVDYTDATWTVTIEDSAVASYADGKLVAAGVGETNVVVGATWRNYTPTTLKTSFKLTVKEDVVLNFEGSTDVTVYTTNFVEGKAMTTTLAPKLYIKNVEQQNPTGLEWLVSDETSANIVSVVNGVVTANDEGIAGTAKVYCRYVSTAGKTYESSKVTVTVEYPVKDSTDKSLAYVSRTSDGTGASVSGADLGESYAVTGVAKEVDGVWTDCTFADGVAAGLPSGEQQLRIKNDSYYIEVRNICVVDKVIKTAADLDEMITILKANKTDMKQIRWNSGGWRYATLAKYDGYFVLGNDIDYASNNFSGISFVNNEFFSQAQYTNQHYPEYGFTGTFDGRGYKISNLNISNNGWGDWDTSLSTEQGYQNADTHLQMGSIFGQIAAEGVVKNVAFDNVNLAGRSVSLLAMQNHGTIENVQVTNASMAQKGYAGVLVGIQAGGTIRNVVVEIDSMISATINGSARAGDGSIFAGPLFGGISGATDPASTTPTPLTGTIENVIVYYDKNVALDSLATVTDNGWAFTRKPTTANDYAWYSGYRITSTDSILTALKTTNNVHCFTNGAVGTVETDGFDAEYWDVTSGAPVFKNKN